MKLTVGISAAGGDLDEPAGPAVQHPQVQFLVSLRGQRVLHQALGQSVCDRKLDVLPIGPRV
jgi:hypothetical protein